MHEIPAGLRISGLRKENGAFRLQADFLVDPGQRAGLAGRSGSGKTTLLRLIAGLEAVDAGEIELGGRRIEGVASRDREIGMVFQEPALFPGLDVLENVAFGLRMRGVGREEREALALPWLDRVGLAAQRYSAVTRLSGGESQRVAFLRAVLWKPRLLLLDEPFSALDPALRKVLRQELTELHDLWPVPLILVSHDEGDLESVANLRLQLIEDGNSRIVRHL